jgi:hypothetical protein
MQNQPFMILNGRFCIQTNHLKIQISHSNKPARQKFHINDYKEIKSLAYEVYCNIVTKKCSNFLKIFSEIFKECNIAFN